MSPQAVGAQILKYSWIYNASGDYAMLSAAFAGVGVGPGTGKNNNYGYDLVIIMTTNKSSIIL